MVRIGRFIAVPCAVAALFAADGAQPWKEKRPVDWTEEEARQILTESPWAQESRLEFAPEKPTKVPQVVFGIPGVGTGGVRTGPGGQQGGGGYPGGGGGGYPGGRGPNPPQTGGSPYPPAGNRRGGPGGYPDDSKLPMVTVRWESAVPIQEAEFKAHDEGVRAPGKVDADFYRIAVFSLAAHLSDDLTKNAKKNAKLQVDGMKDIKPTRVQVVQRENGTVILYWFPRSKEISLDDYAITFDAEFGRLRVVQTYILEKMMFNDKLEM